MGPILVGRCLLLCLLVACWLRLVEPSDGAGARRSQGLGAALGGKYQRLETMLGTFATSTAIQRAARRRGRLATAINDRKHVSAEAKASSDIFVNITDGRNAFQRGMLQTKRQRRWISKRKLRKMLKECEASLQESQEALDAPNDLFVQMAQTCSLEMAAGRYFLRTPDMDVDTYVFSEMPYRYASVLPTSYFVGYLFDEIFAAEKPNAGFTFNVFQNQSEATFEGPLISMVLSSQQMSLQDDNSTLVIYELTQSAEQAEATPLSNFFPGVDPNGNASLTFDHCSFFIDPARERSDSEVTVDAFVAPLISAPGAAQRVDRSASIVEKGPPGNNKAPGGNAEPALRKYARVWRVKDAEGKKTGGVESKDYLKGAADLARSTASFVEKCKTKSNGCDGNDIVSGMSSMMLSFSFVVGAAFPPVGIALTVVGSLGLLISALTLDSSFVSEVDMTIRPSTIQAAVNKALISFTASLDTEVLNSFKDFLQLDIDSYIRRIGGIGYIAQQKGAAGQAFIDEQIDYWYTQEFSLAWGGTYQPALVQIDAKYSTWFGSNENGLRTNVNKWVTECDNVCNVMKAGLIADGNNLLDQCKTKVDDARPNWRNLNSFANAYLEMATKLMSYASQSVVIMQTYSYCDPEKFDQGEINEKCKWNSAIDNLLSKVFATQSRALFLSTAMERLNTECSPTLHGWPFSQSCSESSCNYKWGLTLPTSDWEKRLGSADQQGKFVKLDKSFSRDNSAITCQNDYNKWHESLGFAYGGLYGYTSDFYKEPDYPFALRRGNCGDNAKWANTDLTFGTLTFGAIPNFCLNEDFPKCMALVGDDSLWGTDQSLSDAPLIEYPANLRCKGNSMTLHSGTSRDECWRKCYDEGKMEPIFFFTWDAGASGTQCRCYSTCDIEYSKFEQLYAALLPPP